MASTGDFQGENHCWQKEHKSPSHIRHWTPQWSSRLLGKYSVDRQDKVELFGRCVFHNICYKTNTAFQKNIILTVMAVVVWWSCFAASGPGRLVVIDGTINSALYQKILKENVQSSVCDLKLECTWVLQQENDPQHTSKSTSFGLA